MMYQTGFLTLTLILAANVATSVSTATDRQTVQHPSMTADKQPVVIFMSGDVMTGRAIDQLLPQHNDPVLYELYIRDARDYILLAEKANGPVPRPVNCEYIWGDALDEFAANEPDVRMINLETSITRNDQYWKRKYIHYRMHPKNADCLTLANIDFASVANNHVLDWHYAGLAETLHTLEQADIKSAGAGRNLTAATRPAIIDLDKKGHVIVSAWAHASSGVPPDWAATKYRPGVTRLDDLSTRAVHRIRDSIKAHKQPGDIVDFRISDGETQYERTIAEEPGNYHITSNNGELEVTWYYRAKNEEKTFVLEFRLLDAVKKYEDTAVLYYKFIGTNWQRTSRYVKVRIEPPEGLTEQVRAWAH